MSYAKAIVKYAVRRALTYFISFIIAIILIFLIPRLVPGSPIIRGGPVDVVTYRKLMGLYTCPQSPPWCLFLCDLIQYFIRVFTLNFGISLAFFPKSVMEVIAYHLPYTLALLIPATIASYILGSRIGSIIAYRRGPIDVVIVSISAILSNTPSYILATILLYIFALQLKLFPIGDTWSAGIKPSFTPTFIADFLWHYILPFTSIFLVSTFVWTIKTRFLLAVETFSDQIEYLEVIGLRSTKITKYILRNSISAQLTLLAIELSTTLAGQIIVEKVFNYSGIGFVVSIASSSLDYPLIEGLFTIIAMSIFTANFVVDIVYCILDPRILLRETSVTM